MDLFTNPTSFRNARPYTISSSLMEPPQLLSTHENHPSFGHLILLVFEAVLEVVCVSLPGYIVARQGMFDAGSQKFLAELNVALFTPCLIFTKLASQLTAEKLVDLAIIPLIFAVQTLVSFVCSFGVSKAFGLGKRPRNFVVAMGVFGNSNSLPISLVISLSKTLEGLHWDQIPGDNDDEVAARGILYLLIFQQLGQLVRWSWGYHVLLAPPDKFSEDGQHVNSQIEQGQSRYRDEPIEETEGLIGDVSADSGDSTDSTVGGGSSRSSPNCSQPDPDAGSGRQTPMNFQQYTSSVSSKLSARAGRTPSGLAPEILPTPVNGNVMLHSEQPYPDMGPMTESSEEDIPDGVWGSFKRSKLALERTIRRVLNVASSKLKTAYDGLPVPMQRVLAWFFVRFARFMNGVREFMNPPLWAMLVAIVVASVPTLQRLFFSDGSFVRNSVTRAVEQSGGVAVPLILVVLGGNLARNTLPKDPQHSVEDSAIEKKLLIASIISRMLLPIVIMAPLLALTAKYLSVSILDDPIFIIVCFLLTGAPSALQLAQICQINGVYMGAMSNLLFQSYVVWILPSTLVLVVLALEVVEWAQA